MKFVFTFIIFSPFTFIYGVALYGLILEAFYPFDSLPIDISDRVKESLKSQARDVNFLSAIISLNILTLFFYLMGLLTLVFGSLRLVMRYHPKFREMMEQNAEKALKNQTKQQPSQRAAWSNIAFTALHNTAFTVLLNTAFTVLLSIAMIVNDAIFNRPEDAPSFKDGVVARFQYLRGETRFIIYAQMAIFSIFIFSVVRTIVCYRCQQRAAAPDEESRLAPGEMAEVEGKAFVLEKFVDLSDG